MKMNGEKTAANSLKENKNGRKMVKKLLLFMMVFMLMIFSTGVSFAHCDTMDGPLIKDAKLAIRSNNVNYVLKWVKQENENEIKEAFSLVMKVRKSGTDAQTLADKYFFETVVRLHRAGEGVPFTGVKPSGTPVEEKILAADKALETGNLAPLKELVPAEQFPKLENLFKKAISLRKFDVNNVAAGREYIEAYVHFFKFAEGESEEHSHHEASES
jgi:hypothetical protein